MQTNPVKDAIALQSEYKHGVSQILLEEAETLEKF